VVFLFMPPWVVGASEAAGAPESGPGCHPHSAVSTECLPIACVVSLAQAAVSGRELLVSNYRYSLRAALGATAFGGQLAQGN
jgi:hypothetical protein